MLKVYNVNILYCERNVAYKKAHHFYYINSIDALINIKHKIYPNAKTNFP